jgi:Zn-dependent protease
MIREEIWTFTFMTAFALLLIFGAAALADEPKLPAGYTCADVRAKVSELGYVKALALAIESGATWRQIREARKCLR